MRLYSVLKGLRYAAGGLVIGLGIALLVGGAAQAAGDAKTAAKYPHKQHWHFNGPFGTFDALAVQRGFQVYKEVCASCHSMDLLSYRNLGQKGGPFYLDYCPEELGLPDTVDCSNPNDNPIVKAIAAEYMVVDGPDEFGDMFERPGEPKDRFVSPYANENAARAVNNGAYPPDMSVLTKARKSGPDYIYALLTHYEEAPQGFKVPPGQYYNPYYEGHLLSMAAPLSDGIVDYEDESVPETTSQYAKDVVEFLHWSAEPKLEVRKRLGFMVITYLILFAAVLYWSYRKVWADIEH
ncbi:MAG: cytochrome c1 [Pseudomonadota bacterium]